MKIADLLLKSQKQLQQKNIISAALDSILLLQHATSFSKEQIIFNPNLELSQQQELFFWQLVARREVREPISHIINKREFYGLNFFVEASVLDPRPDSESLIELVLEIFQNKNEQLQILELGVGSGCLIISLLKNLPNATAVAVDISEKALQIANKNALSNQVQSRLELIESDLFSNVDKRDYAQKFDLIISNPPYIPTNLIENLADEVRLFEPRLALDGGVDGYDFYRRIAFDCKHFLKSSGVVAVEVGDDQLQKVQEIFAANNLILNTKKQDLAGFERGAAFIIKDH